MNLHEDLKTQREEIKRLLEENKRLKEENEGLKKVIEIMIEAINEPPKNEKRKTFREKLDAAMEATKEERIKARNR